MRWRYLAVLLLLLPAASALQDCGPDYNFGVPHKYTLVELQDDIACPYSFFPAAVWIYDADGMVLDCKGHTIEGKDIPALRIESTDNLTLVNCTLRSGNATTIDYVDTAPSAVRIITGGDATAYLEVAPPGTYLGTPAAENPAAKVVGRAQPKNETAKPAQSLRKVPYTIALIVLIIITILLIAYFTSRGKRKHFLLIFAVALLWMAQPAEAACTGTACSFSSASCGGVIFGCVNQCSGTANCASITIQGACTGMGCTWAATTCGGTHQACTLANYASQATCEAHGCLWDPAYCDCDSGLGRIQCISNGCNWISQDCSGTPHACSTHNADPTACSAAGCTPANYACSGTASQSCSSYYYKGDATCYTCPDRGCGYGTACTQGSTSCGYGVVSCSSYACGSCPVGGCLKDSACSCTSGAECGTGSCKADYSGGTSYCCGATQCAHSGTCYNSGQYAPDCADASNRRLCSSGNWVSSSCGTDTCTDNGNSNGGGSCSATDYYCSGGSCGSTPTSGTDTCGGTASNPSVTYYSCTGGNTCSSSSTAQSDSCSDTGGILGGGSCSATDWSCAGSPGTLSSSASSGTDTCGGTASNPTVTYYACSGGNSCASALTSRSDTCSDTGNANGGGSCSATNYACGGSPGTITSSSSSGTDTCGGTADNPSVTYYACSGGNSCTSGSTAQADTCSKPAASCSATNYACAGSPGTLSSTATSGTDACATTCTLTTYSCTTADGATADTCSSSGSNTASYKVCSGAAAVDATTPALACDANSNYQDCVDGACSGNLRYSECNGAGACDTTAATYYQASATIYASNTFTLTNTCGTSGTTLCGNSGYNGCTGAGTSATCQKKSDQLRCNGAGTCNTDVGDNVVNIANGNVCTGAGNEVAGSSTNYAFSGTSDRCSSPGAPGSGFGDRVYDVYACNGANAQGADVGDLTTDCGTGCCLDAGATTSCVVSGNTASNFYDFGSGDGTATDYCISAVVKDCSSGSAECSSVSFSCQYNNCIATSGRIMVQSNVGADLAIFDQYGRIILKGGLYQSTATSPAAGSWQIQNAAGTPMGWVSPTGDLYLKGTASTSQGSVTPSGNNDFIIQNSTGSAVAFVDGATGNLYTLSTITTNTIT